MCTRVQIWTRLLVKIEMAWCFLAALSGRHNFTLLNLVKVCFVDQQMSTFAISCTWHLLKIKNTASLTVWVCCYCFASLSYFKASSIRLLMGANVFRHVWWLIKIELTIWLVETDSIRRCWFAILDLDQIFVEVSFMGTNIELHARSLIIVEVAIWVFQTVGAW